MADDSLEFDIQGFEQMKRLLRELPKKVTRQIVLDASKEAMAPMQNDAVMRAPVRTGRLRHNIVLAPKGGQPKGVVALALAVANKAFYGRFLEFGTVKMAARPFMRPAFDANARETPNRFGKAFWPAVAREFDKLRWRVTNR